MTRRPTSAGSPKAELRDVLLKLEFTKLMDKLLPAAPAPAETEVFEGTCESEIVADWDRVRGTAGTLSPAGPCGLPGSAGSSGRVRGVGRRPGGGRAAVFLPTRLENYNGFLRAFFAPGIKKVSHEVKDLTRALLAEGLPAEDIVFDAALAGYLLDATAGHYDLERLAMSWLQTAVPKAEAYLAPEAFTAMGESAEALGALMSHTALIDALYGEMGPKLEERQVEALYFDVEHPLCRVLAEMELAGFQVDAGMLRSFGETLTAAIETLEQRIYSYAGQFNINSPKQLGEVLFERLGLPSYKKTKTGYSTSAEVLEKLRGAHPIVGEVLEYRQYAKLKSTYVDGLLKVISPDGRVRTSFQMTVTATGRLSSTEPNLQNIPTRTELGSELRRMFVAGPGQILVDADYSQIELRLLAHISGDQAMGDAFRSGEDFHTVTAAHVFSVPVEEVTPAMRRAAKAVNFGIVYGISPFSLSQDLGVTVAEAKAYMDAYFHRFPGVKAYMDQVVERARADGYVETPMHRRRALPEIKSSNHNMRSFGERVALNMPIQGAAADIIKLAMVRVHRQLKEADLAARLIMQVHDELIVECPEAEADRVKAILVREMEGALAPVRPPHRRGPQREELAGVPLRWTLPRCAGDTASVRATAPRRSIPELSPRCGRHPPRPARWSSVLSPTGRRGSGNF